MHQALHQRVGREDGKKCNGEDNVDKIDNNNDNDDGKVQQLVSSIKSQFGEIARLCFP